MKELSLPRFRDWLLGLDGRTTAGYPGSPWVCPLAMYLGEGWHVTARAAFYEPELGAGAERRVPLPLWARRFVRAVDGVEPHQAGLPRGVARRVTACRALEVLREVEFRPAEQAA